MRCPHCNGSGRIDHETTTAHATAADLLASGAVVTVAILASAAGISEPRARRVMRAIEAEGGAVVVEMPPTGGRPPLGWRAVA